MGVDPAAPAEEVRAAYLKLARSLHPDRFSAASETERALADRRMREVNAAWAVLGNADARRDYDRELRGPTPPPQRPRASTPPRSPQSPPFEMPEPEARRQRVETVYRKSRRPEFFAGTRGTGPQAIHYVVDEDDDMVEMKPHEVFFLRRLPILIAIAVGLVIFIGTAYISADSNTVPTSPRIPTTLDCHTVNPGGC